MSRAPRSPSPGDAEELALLRGITKQVCAENDTCSPETMKENNVLAKLKQWYHTGKIDEAQWRMRTEVILDASMKRAGFGVEDAAPPAPKRLRSSETMPSRDSKSSLKSRSSSDGEVDDEQYKVGNPGPSKRACDTHSEVVVRDKKLCDAACKFENHVGTKIVVIDANHERQVRCIKNTYMDAHGEEKQQWTFNEETSLWVCQVCVCGNGRSFNPVGEDKFTNKIKHNGTATHTNYLMAKRCRPAFEEGDQPIPWPTGIKLTTEKEYIKWAMETPLAGAMRTCEFANMRTCEHANSLLVFLGRKSSQTRYHFTAFGWLIRWEF